MSIHDVHDGPIDDDHPFVRHCLGIRHEVRNNDMDHVIPVTGRERTGKGGLTYLGACIIDPKWDPDKQVHWSVGSFTATAPTLPKGSINWHDEAVRGATSYNFMDTDNKKLGEFFTIGGVYNLVHLLNYPNLRWVTPLVKEHRSTYNWDVLERVPGKYTVCRVRQLRNDDVIFKKPRPLFYFRCPPPVGRRWDRVLERKKAASDALSYGDGDDLDARSTLTASMRRRLQPLLTRPP